MAPRRRSTSHVAGRRRALGHRRAVRVREAVADAGDRMTPPRGAGSRDDDALPARIARALVDRIFTGQLRPGERVGQDALAAEFGASHVPIRETFRRVEARGYW